MALDVLFKTRSPNQKWETRGQVLGLFQVLCLFIAHYGFNQDVKMEPRCLSFPKSLGSLKQADGKMLASLKM